MFYHAAGYLDKRLVAGLIETGIASIIFIYSINELRKFLRR